MDDNRPLLLSQQLADGMARPLPVLTMRDPWFPRLPGRSCTSWSCICWREASLAAATSQVCRQPAIEWLVHAPS